MPRHGLQHEAKASSDAAIGSPACTTRRMWRVKVNLSFLLTKNTHCVTVFNCAVDCVLRNRANTTSQKIKVLVSTNGVSYNKPTGKWKAKVQCDGVDHYLGLHETPEKAHKAYVDLGTKLHGEFFNAG